MRVTFELSHKIIMFQVLDFVGMITLILLSGSDLITLEVEATG